MKPYVSLSVGQGATWSLLALALTTGALMPRAQAQQAQNSPIANVDACNGKNHASLEVQIAGCTALIKTEDDNSKLSAIAHNNRGNALLSLGKYDLAIEDYNAAIKLNPNYAKALNNRGLAHLKKGEYDQAIADFDAAIKNDPAYSTAIASRAMTYQKKGDYPDAVKDFDAAIKLHPEVGSLWNGRCWARAIAGDLQGALSDCNEAVRLMPNTADALDSRGLTYLKLSQWGLATARGKIAAVALSVRRAGAERR